MYSFLWRKIKFIRDIQYWFFNWKFKQWCKFAKKHGLWVNITEDYLNRFIK